MQKEKPTTAQLVVQEKINSDHSVSVDGDFPGPKEMLYATCQDSSLQPKVVLSRIKPEILQSWLDHSNNRNKYQRAHHLPFALPEEKEEIEPPNRTEKLQTNGKINGHGILSSKYGDSGDGHHATCQNNSLQPKIELTRVNLESFESLLDHSNNNSNYPAVHHHQVSPPIKEKEIDVPNTMEELETQEEINGYGLLLSEEEECDGNNFNKRHHTTHQYTVSQPKVVLTRVNTKLLDSLLDLSSSNSSKDLQNHSKLLSLSKKIIGTEQLLESERPVRKLRTQKRINYEVPSSEDDDSKPIPRVRHRTTRQYTASQPKVVLTRVNTKLLDSLPDYGSSNSSKDLQNHTPSPSPSTKIIETEQVLESERPSPSTKIIETEQVLASERPVRKLRTHKRINYEVPSSDEEEDDKHRPQRRRALSEDLSDSDIFNVEKSTSVSLKPNVTQAEPLDTVSDPSSPHWRQRMRIRRPILRDRHSVSPPCQRQKSSRLVAQKKKNYYISSGSSDEDGNKKYFHKPKKRKGVKSGFESDASFSDESWSSNESRNRKTKKKKYQRKATESELKKEAMTVRENDLSEYEKNRQEKIKQKLAFLESLKELDEVPCNVLEFSRVQLSA